MIATSSGTSRRAPASSFRARGLSPQRPAVAFFCSDAQVAPGGHDVASKSSVAAGLAELLGFDYVGLSGAGRAPSRARYFVPSHTLGLAEARALGLRSEGDLFGGVVPHPFVATKLISHPLVEAADVAPVGWNHAHGRRVAGHVLPGFSVFSHADARRAAQALLRRGALRIKDPHGVGGVGQWVARDGREAEERLQAFSSEALAQGLVLEMNLAQVRTLSVGQVRVGDQVASYYGTQSLTHNHQGQEVYGGSTLVVSRGPLEALLRTRLTGDVRLAVEQALAYHRAALRCYPGLLASRCNYDIAQGVDAEGRAHSGVLEQSWRIGGASGAEVAALRALRDDPTLQRVRASTTEVYGEAEVPPGAWVLYDDTDEQVGRLMKFVQAWPLRDS